MESHSFWNPLHLPLPEDVATQLENDPIQPLLRVKNRSFRSFLRSFFDWDGLTLANATSLSCVLHYHSRLFWCFSNVKRNPFSHLVCSLIILMLVKMANFRSSE